MSPLTATLSLILLAGASVGIYVAVGTTPIEDVFVNVQPVAGSNKSKYEILLKNGRDKTVAFTLRCRESWSDPPYFIEFVSLMSNDVKQFYLINGASECDAIWNAAFGIWMQVWKFSTNGESTDFYKYTSIEIVKDRK